MEPSRRRRPVPDPSTRRDPAAAIGRRRLTRLALLGLGATTIAPLVAACGGAVAPPSPPPVASPSIAASPPGGAATRLLLRLNGLEAPAQQFANAFVADHGRQHGVAVEVDHTDWLSSFAKITTGLAGGLAPDVFMGGAIWIPVLASQQALLPLDPLVQGWAEWADFYESCPPRRHLRRRGVRRAVPGGHARQPHLSQGAVRAGGARPGRAAADVGRGPGGGAAADADAGGPGRRGRLEPPDVGAGAVPAVRGRRRPGGRGRLHRRPGRAAQRHPRGRGGAPVPGQLRRARDHPARGDGQRPGEPAPLHGRAGGPLRGLPVGSPQREARRAGDLGGDAGRPAAAAEAAARRPEVPDLSADEGAGGGLPAGPGAGGRGGGHPARHRGDGRAAGARGARARRRAGRPAAARLRREPAVRDAAPGRAAALRGAAGDGSPRRGGHPGRRADHGGAPRDGRGGDDGSCAAADRPWADGARRQADPPAAADADAGRAPIGRCFRS